MGGTNGAEKADAKQEQEARLRASLEPARGDGVVERFWRAGRVAISSALRRNQAAGENWVAPRP
jgi:hypothetical protein